MFSYVLSFDTTQQKFLAFVAYICAIFLAVIIHENAHGYVALKCGDTTAKDSGRLSFNPARHFSLVGMLIFVVVGVGFAKPVPVNFNNLRQGRKDVVKVSLAGVISNFFLALLSAGLLSLILLIFGERSITSEFVFIIAFFLMQFALLSIIINTALIAFNMLPIYPLDGFRVVTACSKPGNAYINFMYKYGIFVLLGLIIIGNIFPALDVFGYYMSFVRWLILKLFSFIFPNVNLA